MAFIFGGDTGLTPEKVKHLREIAKAMALRRTPRNVGEGIAALGQGLFGGLAELKANQAERAGREEFSNLFGDYFDGTAEAPVAPSQARAASAVPSSSAGEPQELETYIRKAAADRGIDPNTAVKVARAEGLAPGVWQSNVVKNGAREPSYGPFQLLVGGEGTGFPTGLGNEFMQSTGLDPRDQSTAYQQIDFALDQARQGGWSPWYGASRAGVNEWEGINKNPAALAVGQSTMIPRGQVDSLAAPQQVAQALGSAQGGQRRPSGIDPRLMEIINHPYASDAARSVAGALLKQQMEASQPPDPMDTLRQRKLEIEIQRMQRPEQKEPPKIVELFDQETGLPYKAQFNASTGQYEKIGGVKAPSGTSLQVDPETGAVSFQQGVGIKGKPLTESQSKSTTYSVRAEGALPILDEHGDALLNLGEAAGGSIPGIGNYLKSEQYQKAEQAGTEFLQAVLRKDTGAAITKEETEEYGKVYLPQPGDRPGTIEQKRISRQRALDAIKAGMTPSAILAQEKALQTSDPREKAKEELQRRKTQSLPEGVTEDDIQHTMKIHGMTREQVLEAINAP